MSIPADFPVKVDSRTPAACSKPEHLPLVDAAFAKPGGPAAERMKRDLCSNCPIGSRCLAWAMTRREEGIWGGVGPNGRTRHGAPGKDHKPQSVAPRTRSPYQPPTIAADVPVAVLRAWALEHGLSVHPFKGQISKAVREQYVAAHQLAAS